MTVYFYSFIAVFIVFCVFRETSAKLPPNFRDAGFFAKKRGNENIQPDPERDLEDPAYILKMLSRIARVYLASGDDSPVYDGMGGEHSIFAKFFIFIIFLNQGAL